LNEQPPAPVWQTPPEQPGPAPGVQFAPHGERLVAYIIDGFILFIIIMVIAIVLAGGILAGSDFSDPTAPQIAPLGVASSVLIFVLILVLSLGYFPFFWARGGQTPGMKPFGLYVVRDVDGGRISAGQALLRLVGYWINGIVLYIGFIWVFIDARRRGWHDLIAGTVVVKR
jgi:uncharacterized RDD family membrane protein YckC